MSDLAVIFERIKISGFVLAGVFFIAAIYLFFYFNIPKTVGLLTGTTRRKEIEGIRNGIHEKEDMMASDTVVELEQNSIDDTVELEQHNSADTVELGQYNSADTVELGQHSAADTVELGQYNAEVSFVVEEDITFVHTEERIN